jgi:hypothetical protein
MGRLLDALLQFDCAARRGARVLGNSSAGRELRAATADLRRALGAAALHEAAAEADPRHDLQRIFAAAEAAGLSRPDMADALNHFHELKLGRN